MRAAAQGGRRAPGLCPQLTAAAGGSDASVRTATNNGGCHGERLPRSPALRRDPRGCQQQGGTLGPAPHNGKKATEP